jgi:hypothetical protein
MVRLIAALALLAALAVACGDDAATSGIVELTFENASGQEVHIFINGDESRLEEGGRDTISLSGSDEYNILVTGAGDGRMLFSDNLTKGEIEARDNLIVITAAETSP